MNTSMYLLYNFSIDAKTFVQYIWVCVELNNCFQKEYVIKSNHELRRWRLFPFPV